MDKKSRNYLIPNYVIHALIAGVSFLLVAAILGILMFSGHDAKGKTDDSPQETVKKQSIDQRRVVVLDAGHGGSDPGAVADFSDKTEAVIVQEIADRLSTLLQKHPEELQVEVTHLPGTYATVAARSDAALHFDADLLLSLHLNADSNPDTRGFQVYPTPPGRVHHEDSLRLAQLLVKRVQEETEIPIKGDNGVFYAYYHEAEGGGYWREQVDSIWADAENPSASPSFGVVENTGCPAVLVEQWFISNRSDMDRMNHEKGYDAMARSLYLALCDYLEIAPLG